MSHGGSIPDRAARERARDERDLARKAQPIGAAGRVSRARAPRASRATTPKPAAPGWLSHAYEFQIGREVPTVLARAAKRLAGSGAPVTTAQLRELRRVARENGRFDDQQRMFLAGLLDGENARALARTPIRAGATIGFSLGSIQAGMPRVRALGRPTRRASTATQARHAAVQREPAPPTVPGPGASAPLEEFQEKPGDVWHGRDVIVGDLDAEDRLDMRVFKQLDPHPVRQLVRQRPRLARQETIDVEIISSREDYQLGGEVYRVGDAAASRLLMDIQERGTTVVFRVYNFETGAAEEMSPQQWSFFRGAAIIGGSNAGITRLGRQLKPSEWRGLWPNPMPELLRRYEAGQLVLDDEAVLTGYHGMIRTEAGISLTANEKAIDELLGAADRVQRLQEYATGLREASVVRDALVKRREELEKSLVQQHSFTFGLPKAGTGANMAQRLNLLREEGAVEDTLQFWLQAFPLLTRLETNDIESGSVEAKLREIKANIVATREKLDRGRIDPMALDNVRARLTGRLGAKATRVIAAEDKSRSRWALVGAAATLVGSIAILFLPFGVFIDAAIGVAIAGNAIEHAIEVGHMANTSLHVDDGLVSQSQASAARLAAALATVFAVIGVAAAGFRVLRVGMALRGLGQSMPELTLAQRAAAARALADDPALLRLFTRMAPGDAAVSARVAAAVESAAGNTRALRTALQEIGLYARIPRRVPASADLYEPLRKITDGSDIERIATQTGLSRAEVEAAKRNLMLDEHILVDNQGALYRGRFEPYEQVAEIWGRAARGEALSHADREFLKRLVRHEQVEGSLLSAASGRTLEQAFFRGELEGKLRTFLESQGWDQRKIANLLAVEPKPVTPYRYAHLVSALSGAPNP